MQRVCDESNLVVCDGNVCHLCQLAHVWLRQAVQEQPVAAMLARCKASTWNANWKTSCIGYKISSEMQH